MPGPGNLTKRPSTWLPWGQHLDWLRFALSTNDPAAAGPARLFDGPIPQTFESGLVRLAPLIFRSPQAKRFEADEYAWLKETYVAFWAHNIKLIASTGPVLRAFLDNGVAVAVLKGAALQKIAYHGDAATRPTSDLDLLVQPGSGPRAAELLRELGYVPLAKTDVFGPGAFASYAGANFADPNQGCGVDLHWRLNHWQRDPLLHERMWSRRVPLELAGVPVTTLSRTDHLLHAIAHGAGADRYGNPCRWVADCALLIREASADDPIDWTLLLDEARRSGFLLPVRTALRWLVEEQFVEIPDPVLRKLDSMRIRPSDRAVAWVRDQHLESRAAAIARLIVVDYAIRTGGTSRVERARGYPRYLRDTIGDTSNIRNVLREGPLAKR